MNRGPHLRDYQIKLYWERDPGYWVAEIEDIPFCAADGPTEAEAVSNLAETFAVLKESYAEEGMDFPGPARGTITTVTLDLASDLLNMSQVAKIIGISPQTLHSRMRRNTPLKAEEARKISRAMADRGVIFVSHAAGSAEKTSASIAVRGEQMRPKHAKALI